MRSSTLLLSLFLTSSSVALAQPAPDASATRTLAAGAPAAAPLAAPTATAPLAAPATTVAEVAPESKASAVRCELGEVARVDLETARGWLALLCQEIAKQESTPGIYRLHLYQLDKTTLLRLTAERGGLISSSEQVQIASADELPVIGPRLVRAVVQNKPFSETAGVESVSRAEARVLEKKPGTLLLGGGIFAATFGGAAHTLVPAGLNLTLSYETARFAAVADARAIMVGNERNSDSYKVSWANLSVGGRYFVSDGDLTPLLGAGLLMGGGSESKGYSSYGWEGTSNGGSEGWKRSGSGAGVYLETGIEALRLHNGGRLVATARVEVPFFQMRNDSSAGSSTTSSYLLPITFGASYYFR